MNETAQPTSEKTGQQEKENQGIEDARSPRQKERESQATTPPRNVLMSRNKHSNMAG